MAPDRVVLLVGWVVRSTHDFRETRRHPLATRLDVHYSHMTLTHDIDARHRRTCKAHNSAQPAEEKTAVELCAATRTGGAFSGRQSPLAQLGAAST